MAEDIMNHSDITGEERESAQFAIRVHFFLGGIMNAYQPWGQG